MAVLALLFMSLGRYKEVRQAEKTWYTARQWTSFDMYEDAVPEYMKVWRIITAFCSIMDMRCTRQENMKKAMRCFQAGR